MPDGCKQILSPFTGHKKQKAWIKTRKKYMLLKNLPETDRGSYYKEEWLEEFLDSKGPFYNGNKIIIMMSYNENNEQQQLPDGFANSCYKIVSQILLQNLINEFAVCKHYIGTLLLDEDVSHSFETRTTYFKKELHFLIYQPRTCHIFMLCA